MCFCFKISTIRLTGIIMLPIFLVYLVSCLIYCLLTINPFTPVDIPLNLSNYVSIQLFILGINIVNTFYGFLALLFSKNRLTNLYTIINGLIIPLSFYFMMTLMLLGWNTSTKYVVADNLSMCYDDNSIQKGNTAGYSFKIDNFMIEADKRFCSNDCPCNININQISEIVLNMKKNISDKGAVNFQECNLQTREIAIKISLVNGEEINKFYKEMEWLENKLNCCGYCIKNYIDSNGMRHTISNYMFSNINNGIPVNVSCLPKLISWIEEVCRNFVITDVFILFIDIALVVIGVSFKMNFSLNKKRNNHFNQTTNKESNPVENTNIIQKVSEPM